MDYQILKPSGVCPSSLTHLDCVGWPGDLHIPKESLETPGSSNYDNKDIYMELRQNTSEDLEC